MDDERRLCAKCGSNHWMTNLPVPTDGVTTLTVAAGVNWLGLPYAVSPVVASVCGDCGYTEFYAGKHSEMWDEWRKRNT